MSEAVSFALCFLLDAPNATKPARNDEQNQDEGHEPECNRGCAEGEQYRNVEGEGANVGWYPTLDVDEIGVELGDPGSIPEQARLQVWRREVDSLAVGLSPNRVASAGLYGRG